ncbi:hypothetical protein [Nonomuraea sp. NPDC001699]
MQPDGLWRIIRIGLVGLVLAATVAGLMIGDSWLWVAVEWSPPAQLRFYAPNGFDTLTTVTLLAAAPVKAVLLWLILRAPAPGPLDGRAKVLRLLLCLAVAYMLVLWVAIALLPDVVGAAFRLALWTSIDVLYLLVIRWRSWALRTAAGAVFAVDLTGMANELLDELDLSELGSGGIVGPVLMLSGAAATVITVLGQWRDGRWSRGTLIAGWSSVGVWALVIPLSLLFAEVFGGSLATAVVMDAVGLVSLVWLAATARELPTDDRLADLPPARRRAVRVAVAAVVVLPIIAAIHPEQNAYRTYTATHTGTSPGCYDRPSFGDLEPAERDAAFLCLARSTTAGIPPMFPDNLSDQAILAYGRALCRARDRDEQEVILKRAGSARPASGASPWDLVYVCPEIVGATNPELLRSTAETKAAHDAYIAKENAKCRDPWPRTKGVVQATANYFLFVDGDPGYLVHDPADEAAEVAAEQATDRSYDDSAGIGVSRSAALIGHVEDVSDLCLTVKALRTAPPRRTAGWDQVDEVPIVSLSGRLTVPEKGEGEVGAGAPMPNLAIAGKGGYRLRVYVRIGETGEEHLVVVFPGTSRKRLTLKP